MGLVQESHYPASRSTPQPSRRTRAVSPTPSQAVSPRGSRFLVRIPPRGRSPAGQIPLGTVGWVRAACNLRWPQAPSPGRAAGSRRASWAAARGRASVSLRPESHWLLQECPILAQLCPPRSSRRANLVFSHALLLLLGRRASLECGPPGERSLTDSTSTKLLLGRRSAQDAPINWVVALQAGRAKKCTRIYNARSSHIP